MNPLRLFGGERPAGEASARRNWRVLIVTSSPAVFEPVMERSVIVGGADVAMSLIGNERFDGVFCDAGQIASGALTGYRFANRCKAQGVVAPVYLMTESVTPGDQAWARRNGAADLVRRCPKEMIRLMDWADASQDASGGVSRNVSAADKQAVSERLRRYIGPAADVLYDNELARLQGGAGKHVAFDRLVRVLSENINNKQDRARFLSDTGLASQGGGQ